MPKTTPIKASSKPSQKRALCIVRDTREQDGFTFKDLPVNLTTGTLTTGDYSVVGFESRIACERKSLQDLVGCLGHGRERFQRELARMKAMDFAAVVIEAPESALLAGHYRGALNPKAGMQSVVAWNQRYNVSFIFCRDKEMAEQRTYDLLRHYANDRWLELRALERDWADVDGSQA